jgi:hypothetical protein
MNDNVEVWFSRLERAPAYKPVARHLVLRLNRNPAFDQRSGRDHMKDIGQILERQRQARRDQRQQNSRRDLDGLNSGPRLRRG